jgi:hypothetical protein
VSYRKVTPQQREEFCPFPTINMRARCIHSVITSKVVSFAHEDSQCAPGSSSRCPSGHTLGTRDQFEAVLCLGEPEALATWSDLGNGRP